MTVIEHLDELRYRIIISLAALAVGTAVGYTLYDPILDLLKGPIDSQGRIGGVQIQLYNPGIAGPFLVRLKVSFFAGVVFALPVLLYQLWRFITPGLYPKEKKYAIPFVASSLALFGLGGWFASIVMEPGIRFLLGFVNAPELTPLITFPEYLSFVIFMILAFGITFEFPLVLIFLAAVGVVSSRALRRWRRWAILIIFIVAAVATPSGDPFSQLAMAAPLYLLYEASILVVRFAMKK